MNKAKVDVGTSPPLDLVSAQAEVAADQEQLIIAETAVKQAEDRLRLLIFDPTEREQLERDDRAGRLAADRDGSLDLDAAVTHALRGRADLLRARKDIENADRPTSKFADNQRLPDVRLNASYQASGLGGTQVLRTGGFPGTIVGPGTRPISASCSNQLFAHDYPTWAVGVSVSLSDRRERRAGQLRARRSSSARRPSSG